MNAKKAPPDADARTMTPAERGHTLKRWLKYVAKTRIGDFAQVTNIHPATLARYFSGVKDLATVEQEIAERLLTGMGISDEKAWALLAIPEAHRGSFRSFRPPPLGHGPDVFRTVTEILPDALMGEAVLPANTGVELEPDNLDSGIQIVQLEDGRFHAVTASTVPRIVKRRLGRLVTAHFAARPA